MADKKAADQIEENFVKMRQKIQCTVIEYVRRKEIKGSQPFISLLEPEEHNDEDAPTSGKCLHMVQRIRFYKETTVSGAASMR